MGSLLLLLGGAIVTGISGLIDRGNQKKALEEQEADARAAAEAERQATEAEWQLQMENARQEAEDLQESAANLRARSERMYGMAYGETSGGKGAIQTAYGKGGTAGLSYENLLIQNAVQRGTLTQSVATSGLKNSGNMTMMAGQLASGQAMGEQATRQAMEAEMTAAMGQTDESYSQAQETAGEMDETVQELAVDWAGFDWDQFQRGAGVNPLANKPLTLPGWSGWAGKGGTTTPYGAGGPMANTVAKPKAPNPYGIDASAEPSLLQRLYYAKGKAVSANNQATWNKYDQAYEALNSPLNLITDLFNGAKMGLQLGSGDFMQSLFQGAPKANPYAGMSGGQSMLGMPSNLWGYAG